MTPGRAEFLRAAVWMLGAITSFSAMAIAGREIGQVHDTFEIMTFRSLVGVVIVGAIVVAKRHPVRSPHMGVHVFRNLAHFTGQNLWFYALTLIPLAQVFALEFTAPIWAILLAPLILAEPLRRRGVMAALVGFVGILIVTRPFGAPLSAGILAGAGCAVAFGLTAVLTRRLTRSDAVLTILFWLTLMQAIMGIVCAGYDGAITPPTSATLPWLVLIGLCGLSAHYCLTTALSLAPASVVMPMDFARLPVIAVLGAWIYGETLDPLVFAGAALIIAGNMINLKNKG